MTVGALVATTAVTGLRYSSVSAHELTLRQDDARRSPIAAGLQFPADPFGHVREKVAYQDQDGRSSTPRRYDIAAGPLGDVGSAFERASGVHLTLAITSIASIQSPGVSGTFTTEQALQVMLAGTGVRFRLTSATTVVLDLATYAADVEVAGRAPETVVSSPKYTVPLHDVPQTIEVVSRGVMDQQGSTTLTDALRNVPGITLQAGEGGGASRTTGDMFNMRGFSANNSLFVDGVRNDGLIARDVFNVEQVDVFLGPTGSDTGRATAGGYVNMETKVPHAGARYPCSTATGRPIRTG